MNRLRRLIQRSSACLLMAGVAVSWAQAAIPQHPFPQHVPHTAGTILPNHRTQALLDQDVRDAYNAWRLRFLSQAGTESDGHPRYRVRRGLSGSDATVSEGQGYGMLIVVLMAGADPDAQTVFDGLWEYFNDHRSEIDNRLMDFFVPADEMPAPGDDNCAFDGDVDIAMALLIAEAQWGNGGRINYRSQALAALAGLATSVMGPNSKLPLLGDWVDPQGAQYNEYTVRSSDFMPGHFVNFLEATANPIWRDALPAMAAAIDDIQQVHSPTTGLLPDFLRRNGSLPPRFEPAPAMFLEGPHDGHYYYNAGRDAWRLGSHALLHSDPRAAAQVQRMSDWIAASSGGDPQLIRPGYLLDGTPVTTAFFTSFFAAPFGVAAMLDPAKQAWLNAIYDAVRGLQEDYYEDSVSLLCLLVMTGNYWDPIAFRDLVFADGFE